MMSIEYLFAVACQYLEHTMRTVGRQRGSLSQADGIWCAAAHGEIYVLLVFPVPAHKLATRGVPKLVDDRHAALVVLHEQPHDPRSLFSRVHPNFHLKPFWYGFSSTSPVLKKSWSRGGGNDFPYLVPMLRAPRLRLYCSGLMPPSNLFLRFSLCHTMWASIFAPSSSSVAFDQSLP